MKKNAIKTALLIIGIFILTIGGALGVALLTENKDSSNKNVPNQNENVPVKVEEGISEETEKATDDDNTSVIKCLTKFESDDYTISTEHWNFFYDNETKKLKKIVEKYTIIANTYNLNNSQLAKVDDMLKENYDLWLKNSEETNKNNDLYRGVTKEDNYDKNNHSISNSTIIDIKNVTDEYLDMLLDEEGTLSNYVDDNLIFDSERFLEYANNNGMVCEKE